MDRTRSVAELLDACREVVPFHGRASELAQLTGWRDDATPLAAMLLHGAAGAGKTRLVNRFREDWDASAGRLVVVDDAEHWAWQDLFAVLQESMLSGPLKTRVVLVARSAGWWWSSTRQRAADLDYVLSDLELAPSLEDRTASFALACTCFADALGVDQPVSADPPAIAGETVLDLHMAALVAVFGDPFDVNRTQLAKHLLARETGTPSGRLAEDYLAVATPDDADPDLLVRAARRWPHLLARAEKLFVERPGLVGEVKTSTLMTMTEIASLPPLEAIARQVFNDDRFNYDALPAALTRRLVEHNLARSEDLLEQAELWGMLSARTALAGLRTEAVEASEREVAAYRELAESDPEENRPALADALNDLGLRLIAVDRTDEVLAVSEEAVSLWKDIARADPETVPQLAAALEQVSFRYSALGKREEAMDAISRAALMFQELAKLHPALFRLDFARVAGNLAMRLFTVGRRDEAADAAHWSLVNWRAVAEEDPRYEPDLARALTSVGRLLANFGRPAESAAAIEESITVFRRLAAANPAMFNEELARALVKFSAMLIEVERDDEALPVAHESVELWREIGDPAGLAGALSSLGKVIEEVGDFPDQLAVTREAVELLRPLAAENPIRHQVELAIALAALCELLLINHTQPEAHDLVREILEISDRLPQQLLIAHGAQLALALHILGRALSDLGHHDHAIAVSELVVCIWRGLVHRNQSAPIAYILAVHQLALNLRGAERHEESRAVAHTTVVLWHMARPSEELDKLPSYADALCTYGRLCAEARHDLDNAMLLTHRAVLIMRDAGDDPEKLEQALEALEAVLEAFDDRSEAQARLQAMVDVSWL